MLDNDLEETWLFTVTDLKQYMYCARVFYYHVCLPHIRPLTYKMEAGMEAHAEEPKRALRRSFVPYGAESGQRFFDVAIQSTTLALSGSIDEVVDIGSEMIPVDYKLARKAGYHYKIQLTAYALLLEVERGAKVERGFLYLIPLHQAVEVPITAKMRRQVRRALREMTTIATTEHMPPATKWQQRCPDCEFRRFCNDV